MARAWHSGIAYPHWVQDANFGAGEPRLIFYPPASWLLGALLGTIRGWHAAPVLFVLLALFVAGCSIYLLARERASPVAASFAACLYVTNPYAMFVVYERSALGELLAAVGSRHVPVCVTDRTSMAPLGLSVAALSLTKSPAAVMGSYLLAVLAPGMWIVERRPSPALGQRAEGAGAGLAAVYIILPAFEQRWVQIDRAINPGMRVEDSFLFAHTKNPFHDQVWTASWIFIAGVAVASIAAYLASRKRAEGGRNGAHCTASHPSVAAITRPALSLAAHTTFEVLAVSVALDTHTERGDLPARGYGSEEDQSRYSDTGGGVHRRDGNRRRPAFLSALRRRGQNRGADRRFRQGQGTQGTDRYTPAGADNSAVQQDLPWCACCLTRRMTPPTAARGITRSGRPEPRAASRQR